MLLAKVDSLLCKTLSETETIVNLYKDQKIQESSKHHMISKSGKMPNREFHGDGRTKKVNFLCFNDFLTIIFQI